MAWILFDEADHHIPAPNFCLSAQNGEQVCLRDYQEDCNLVVLITSARNDVDGRTALESFNTQLAEYRELDARIFAISTSEGRGMKQSFGLAEIGFPLLSDPEGKVRQAYAGLMDESLTTDEDILIFVLDRYNAPYAAWVGKEFLDPTLHREVQSWLAFIGVQCPE